MKYFKTKILMFTAMLLLLAGLYYEPHVQRHCAIEAKVAGILMDYRDEGLTLHEVVFGYRNDPDTFNSISHIIYGVYNTTMNKEMFMLQIYNQCVERTVSA